MDIKTRLSKLEQSPALRPAPELTLIIAFADEQERAAAQARFDSQPPGPLRHVCVIQEDHTNVSDR